jgi:hypothetical protein
LLGARFKEEAMAYVRISIMHPNCSIQLQEMQEDLLQRFKVLPGFLDGYLMVSMDGTGRIGRVTMWRSARDADHAALDQDVFLVRSRMSHLIENESEVRLEQGFLALRA